MQFTHTFQVKLREIPPKRTKNDENRHTIACSATKLSNGTYPMFIINQRVSLSQYSVETLASFKVQLNALPSCAFV